MGDTNQLEPTDGTPTVLDPPPAPPGQEVPESAPSAAPQVLLPSERLRRLADTTTAALALPTPAVDHERTLPPEALARVLDAVEASTAAATKKAYRSDWDRFATWAGRSRTTSPRPPLSRPASANGGTRRPR